ncbi:MAG TPA: hypothetical protein VLG12_07220 [Candidatus Saccharimonadales bacterium]|nr:hypothetical protein [Candidatus Saccharimonadales bacterium]
MQNWKKIFFIFMLFIIVGNKYFCSLPIAHAAAKDVQGAATLGIAQMVEVNTKNVQDGSILSSSKQGAVLSSVEYDPQVVGVVSRDAGILFNTDDNGVPVISNGTVYVLVSTKEGSIKKGDSITSSSMPGVGVKAVTAGYVLGTALEDDSNPDPKKVDKIAVDLNLHYFNSKPSFSGTLSDILKVALLPTKDAPAPLFKYIVAAMVVLGSFALGFLSFGRTAAKGVEALGRNPAASKIINLGIIFNVFIVIVIVLAGLTVAFLILRL